MSLLVKWQMNKAVDVEHKKEKEVARNWLQDNGLL